MASRVQWRSQQESDRIPGARALNRGDDSLRSYPPVRQETRSTGSSERGGTSRIVETPRPGRNVGAP
jgi:hypothetical protein